MQGTRRFKDRGSDADDRREVYHVYLVDTLDHGRYRGQHEVPWRYEAMTLLQVRQAARALGVHENTVRRWEEKGLLHAVRLPSGVRRFDSREIDAVRSRMYEGLPPMEEGTDDVAAVKATPID
jgi:excisionase family DNA binding protein